MRIGAIALIAFSIYKYEENPLVFMGLIIISLFTIFCFGEEEIVIYNNSIVQKNNSLQAIIFNSKQKELNFDSIKRAYVEALVKPSASDIGIAALLLLLLPKINRPSTKTSTICFELKDGQLDKIETTLGIVKLEEVIHNVNILLKKKA